MNVLKKCGNIHRKSYFKYSTQLFSSVSDGFSFELNENQKLLKEKASKFVREEIIPVASHYDRTGEFPFDIVEKSHKLGLINTLIPKDIGGSDLGSFDTCLIAEELAYGCAGITVPILVSSVGQMPLIIAGNKHQKLKYLGRLIEEPLLAAFCLTEPSAGSDVNGIRCTAVKKGNEYIINGQKIWITNAGVANWFFVLARTNPDLKAPASQAFTGFIVDSGTEGIKIGRKEWNMGQRASDTRGITFEDVRIPEENVILGEGAGFKVAMKSLDMSRPCVAACSVGLAKRALEEATKYLMNNNELDTCVLSQQATSLLLADMVIGIEIARLSWQKSAWLADLELDNTLIVSAAKVFASEIAGKCTDNALQILGNNGCSNVHPIEKLVRDAKILQIYEGTSQIQRLIISRKLTEMAAQGAEQIRT